MSKPSSIWTNPLVLVLILLALIWVFTVVKFCGNTGAETANNKADEPVSPIPGYSLLPELLCPLKLSAADQDLANGLLQQYFRTDSLNRFQEAVWRPDKRLDPVFAQIYEGNWETYVECIQTLGRDSSGMEERIAIMASNFPDNDCNNCAPYIGYIRFTMRQDDPATAVIRKSDRALFPFGAYGAIGDQIGLVRLGA
ncbi:MAG: hypothetical protein KDD04_11535, partial [Sinomicrobium sp.]|nr:hypothetical protein [Sinomicrobium sp.]